MKVCIPRGNVRKYFWLAITSLYICTSKAQIATGSDFKQYFSSEISKIATKVYQAGLAGKIKAYRTDSLSSTWELSQLKWIGATTKYIADKEGNLFLDTQLFSIDSLLPDIGVGYRIMPNSKGAIELVPWSLSIGSDVHWYLNEKIVSVEIPLFHASVHELENKFLDKDEVKFLKLYFQYKLFDKGVYLEDTRSNLLLDWEELNNVNLYRSGMRVSHGLLGEHLYDYMRLNLFVGYNAGLLVLKNIDGGRVTNSDYSNNFSKTIPVKISPDWSDPAKMRDTMMRLLPDKFDSIAFGFQDKKPVLVLLQKNPNTLEYVPHYADMKSAKAVLPGRVFSWLEWFYRNRFE